VPELVLVQVPDGDPASDGPPRVAVLELELELVLV